MSLSKSLVLTYHSLDNSGSVISTDPAVFREQMEILAAQRVPVVPLSQIRNRPGAVALTFDDAFLNVAEIALPILDRHGFPASIFAVSGYTGLLNNWPSQPSGIPWFPLMSWSDLEYASRQGFEIGAHTVNHPHLGSLPPAEASREMQVCSRDIASHTGILPVSFAYPYGDAPADVRTLAARHFRVACTTSMTAVSEQTDPAAIGRIDSFYLKSPFWFERLFQTSGQGYLAGRRLLRSVRSRLLAHRSKPDSIKLQFEQ